MSGKIFPITKQAKPLNFIIVCPHATIVYWDLELLNTFHLHYQWEASQEVWPWRTLTSLPRLYTGSADCEKNVVIFDSWELMLSGPLRNSMSIHAADFSTVLSFSAHPFPFPSHWLWWWGLVSKTLTQSWEPSFGKDIVKEKFHRLVDIASKK